MGFKENILQKIEIDNLCRSVKRSLGKSESGIHYDKQSMRRLLALGDFAHIQQRDLDLYVLANDAPKKRILVLDNGLGIYHTTVEDVCLRKSPTVKEMLSIRNAIKILNDKDVLISKRDESVSALQQQLIQGLDLSFNHDDIDAIAIQGQTSLESGYGEGILEALNIFGEILGLQTVPKVLRQKHYDIRGGLSTRADGKSTLVPVVIFSQIDNRLQLIDTPIATHDKTQIDLVRQIVNNKQQAPAEGKDVFTALKQMIVETHLGH